MRAVPTVLAAGGFFLAATSLSAQTVSIVADVTVRPRSAVAASTQVVQFTVAEGESSAEALVEFSAGARTMPSTSLLLTLETGPLAAAGPESCESTIVIAFDWEGPGLLRGTLPPDGRADVAQWRGGGLRHGRLRLVLRGVAPGTYRLPVRLAITGI